MTDTDDSPAPAGAANAIARRRLLAGGVGVAGIALVAGCGEEEPPTAPDPQSGGAELGSSADVAVGGGVIFAGEKVVVTQPAKGDFRAFDSTCTHQGCQVTTVTKTINCECHGSQFSLEDGSVVTGPAEEPLAAKKVTDKDGTLQLS